MFEGIRTLGLDVLDLDAAKAWYTKVLGLHPPGEDAPADAPRVATTYWSVPDVERALADLVAHGATPAQPAMEVGGGIVVGSVVDPFGHTLGVIQNPVFAPPLTEVDAASMSDRVIEKSALLAARPEAVWKLWTGGEAITSWLGVEAHVDLRIGGAFHLFFDSEAKLGDRGSEGFRILSFLPGRMLSFTWNAPPTIPECRHRRTWVVVELIPEGEGCRITLSHLGWPEGEVDQTESPWAKTYAYFDAAWGKVLEALAAHTG